MLDLEFFRLDTLVQALQRAGMQRWAQSLPAQVEAEIRERQHGDIPRWQAALDELPKIAPARIDLDAPAVTAAGAPLPQAQRVSLEQTLLRLSPWRKGPFHLHGVDIDTPAATQPADVVKIDTPRGQLEQAVAQLLAQARRLVGGLDDGQVGPLDLVDRRRALVAVVAGRGPGQ